MKTCLISNEVSFEQPPRERDYVPFEDFRRDPERHPLKTPSGRIEIVSEDQSGISSLLADISE